MERQLKMEFQNKLSLAFKKSTAIHFVFQNIVIVIFCFNSIPIEASAINCMNQQDSVTRAI